MKSLQQYILEEASEINGFCILKPGFLDHTEDWINMLKNAGWQVVQQLKSTLTPELAKELYKVHAEEDWYGDLVKYMSSDDCLCCACHKDCKEPIKDMKAIKNKCRDAWGEDEMKNAMHSSDSIDNVNRERKLIFENKK